MDSSKHVEYHSNEEYFRDHPDEEAAYYDDMAALFHVDEIIEYPEDWVLAHS